jgi:hypothetical protein
MGRRELSNPAVSAAERAEAEAEAVDRRYRRLAFYGAASDPEWPVSVSIRTERDRIDRGGGPISDRLRRLERYVDDLGVLDEASAHVDRYRTSWR